MSIDKLYIHCRDKYGSLAEIIQELRESYRTRTIGIVYAPGSCQFVVVSDGDLVGAHGIPISLDDAYEVRLFNEQLELRWLHEHDGGGRASIISEMKCTFDNYSCVEQYDVKKVEHSYVLWGESPGELSGNHSETLPSGWSRLSEARIGHIDVPINLGSDPGWRVQLKAIEYIAIYQDTDVTHSDTTNRLERHGNSSVIEDRLISLVAA